MTATSESGASAAVMTALGAFSGSILTTLLAVTALELSLAATIPMVIFALVLPFGLAFFTTTGKTARLRLVFLVVIVAPLVVGGALRMSDDRMPPLSGASYGSAPLTEFQLKHGIGPVTEELGISGIDSALVAEGEQLFRRQCASCHKLDERLVGPALRDVANRRSPEYMMNMILNPAEMVQRHPEARKLLAQHLTVMTYQGVTVEQARALVEFLRFSAGQSTVQLINP